MVYEGDGNSCVQRLRQYFDGQGWWCGGMLTILILYAQEREVEDHQVSRSASLMTKAVSYKYNTSTILYHNIMHRLFQASY
jgi:hypothetical protein